MTESNTEVVQKPNWVAGILAGIVAGVIGAIIYAAIIAFTEEGTEIGYLALLIGFGAGFGLKKFGKVSGVAAGIVGAIIGLVCWAFAVELGVSWWLAEQGAGSALGNLGDIIPETSDFFELYFEESPKGYLFALFAAGAGFLTAYGLKRSKK